MNPNKTSNYSGDQLSSRESHIVLKKLGGLTTQKMFKTMGDFKAMRNNREVEDDIAYLNERIRDFRPKSEKAMILEKLATIGFVSDQWLGNVSSKTGKLTFGVAPVYSAGTTAETEYPYDDVVNRIDFAVMTRPADEEDGTFIGFDVTLNEGDFYDKLFRTTSDQSKRLPFGFSGLDYAYLSDGTLFSKTNNVPRYVISMELNPKFVQNYTTYKEILANADPSNQADDNRTKDAKRGLENTRRGVGFVVLSEIYEQNSLYLSMLPELNGRDNTIINDARDKLEKNNDMLWAALNRATFEYRIEHDMADVIARKKGEEYDTSKYEEIEKLKSERQNLNLQIKALKDDKSLSSEAKKARRLDLQKERYELVLNYAMKKDHKQQALIGKVRNLRKMAEEHKLDKYRQIQERNNSSPAFL